MSLRTFEDIAVGETHRAGPIRVTREAIIAFAEMYDPQPCHLDEASGAASLLGGLAASGWHTSALGMRLLFDGFVHDVAGMGAPGIDEMRWLKPLLAGDTLDMTLTVESARPSSSRPDRGFVGATMILRNGRGDVVASQRFTMIVARRSVTEAAGATAGSPAGGASVTPPLPPADPMLAAYLDEFEIGHAATFGTQPFTPDTIVAFAALYDPQPFHLDADAARRSHFGGLCASGWHTAACWMKHYIAARTRSADTRAHAGRPVAVGGPSPGFTDLKWLRPVHAGCAVRYGLTVTGKRPVSRPGWGLLAIRGTGHVEDALVFSFDGLILWPVEPGRT